MNGLTDYLSKFKTITDENSTTVYVCHDDYGQSVLAELNLVDGLFTLTIDTYDGIKQSSTVTFSRLKPAKVLKHIQRYVGMFV